MTCTSTVMTMNCSTSSSTITGNAMPAVAANRSGDFAMAWTRQDVSTDGPDILLQFFDAEGMPQGDAFLVNSTVNAGPQFLPTLAMNDSGQAVVVWNSFDEINDR